jgi:3-methyladenine DNA glycosylase AlkD
MSIVKEIIVALKELGDPGRKEKSKTYFPTSMEVLGVTAPKQRALIKELKEQYRHWTAGDWISLGKALVATGIFECQTVAFSLISENKDVLDALQKKDLQGLAHNLDNWASVDLFSVGIHGILWRKGVVTNEDIERLIGSDNHWERRIAIVSTVSLNLKSRGGTGDTKRTLWVCAQVVDDRNEMVRKALSWALRELSKRDRTAVVIFLEEYRPRLAGRVIREVSHKLDFGTKN